jgi:ankyrin repeat protein
LTIILQLSGDSNAVEAYPDINDAVNNNDTHAVRDFVMKNPDFANFVDENGRTPLHAAALGRKEIAEFLIANGADVDARKRNGVTPLHVAAARGHGEIVKLLISGGANVNARTNDGETALHKAAESGYTETAELLLSNGANVNAVYHGETPLFLAKTEEMKALLRKYGAE